MTRTVEDAAAALQATRGTTLTIRARRAMSPHAWMCSVASPRAWPTAHGVLQEGFDDAEGDVRDLVLAAVDVLGRAGADVTKISIPAHHAIRTAQAALTGEGALALFKTGFFGAFTRTTTRRLIAAIHSCGLHADVLARAPSCRSSPQS